MDSAQLFQLSATEAALAIREGRIDSEQLIDNCLARIDDVETQIQAWQFLDPDYARRQARARDQDRRRGEPVGPLHGVPVGIKDIIDTADMPTEDGTVLHAGRTPAQDAAAVERLRAAGAVILGKTVTTECATYAPGKTTNPYNPEHTPGGSSSGSAAAVAAGMVPLALGSQTNGSIIRPAAYCGVYGFKPTHGLISRHGVLRLSRTLDHLGLFARSIEDIALGCEVLAGGDERDPDTRLLARVPYQAIAAEEPPMTPMITFIRTPLWERTETDTRDAFAEVVAVLGDRVQEVVLPDTARQALDLHRTIMEAEMAAALAEEYERGRDQLSSTLCTQLERGRGITAYDYQRALAHRTVILEGVAEVFDRFDAILTPAVAGTAPRGLASTGDPAFCTLWSLCGMPALALPLMHGANGLPLGVQLVGPRHHDARLLRTARWLVARAASGES